MVLNGNKRILIGMFSQLSKTAQLHHRWLLDDFMVKMLQTSCKQDKLDIKIDLNALNSSMFREKICFTFDNL